MQPLIYFALGLILGVGVVGSVWACWRPIAPDRLNRVMLSTSMVSCVLALISLVIAVSAIGN